MTSSAAESIKHFIPFAGWFCRCQCLCPRAAVLTLVRRRGSGSLWRRSDPNMKPEAAERLSKRLSEGASIN